MSTIAAEQNDPREGCRFEAGQLLHLSSQIHLDDQLLRCPKAREILECLIRDYARVCRVEVLHYGLGEGRFDVLARVLPDSEPVGKFMGCIKAGFTRTFKRWFNDRRPEQRSLLGLGSMWGGPYRAVILEEDDLHAAACLVNTEQVWSTEQRLVEALEQAPDEEGRGPVYAEILRALRRCSNHSADFYLSGRAKTPAPVALTDGTDAVWATEEEVRQWWRKPVADLPRGWRRICFRGEKRILKRTLEQERSLPDGPWWQGLGGGDEERAVAMAASLCLALWKRHVGQPERVQPGADREPGGDHAIAKTDLGELSCCGTGHGRGKKSTKVKRRRGGSAKRRGGSARRRRRKNRRRRKGK